MYARLAAFEGGDVEKLREQGGTYEVLVDWPE